MSSKLSPYGPPPPFRSSLLKNAPDAVPPTEELEALHAELRNLKTRTLERAKKAGDDLRAIEESMRRMKEREKGKFKAVDKIKRERDFTPTFGTDEQTFSTSLHAKPSRVSSHAGSVPPSSSRLSQDPRRSAHDDLRKKKKKRKRETEDSDAESELQRPRKTTPPAAHVHHSQPPKAPKPVVSVTQPHTKLPAGPDFTVPPPHPLLPPRPPIPAPPTPGPSKPTEVMDDFSKSKQPTQIPIITYYGSIEPWIRPIREEDVGFLEYTGDELEPYIMPKLGRHYLEVWDEQDAGLFPLLAEPPEAPPSTFAAPVPKWDPSTLMEPDLVTEDRGHGPLTERVISALLPMPDITVWKGVKAAEDAMEGRPGGSGAAAARREKMNVSELEARIRDTMRLHGLLDGVPDYTEKVDDPISTALRQAQRELRTVVATNKARRERIVAIARDRLGYQEYLELRDSIDKNISNTFSKLQKKDGPKLGKKKKKPSDSTVGAGDAGGGGGTGNGTGPPALPPPCPAALGFGSDEENRLLVSDQLRQLVETRRQWVDTVGAVFEQKQREDPGRIWGTPEESVYRGIEEEVRAMAVPPNNGNNPPPPVQPVVVPDGLGRMNGSGGKGKEKARGDEMDVG